MGVGGSQKLAVRRELHGVNSATMTEAHSPKTCNRSLRQGIAVAVGADGFFGFSHLRGRGSRPLLRWVFNFCLGWFGSGNLLKGEAGAGGGEANT